MNVQEERLLLTGFEPFGRWAVNPSALVAAELDGEVIGDVGVIARQLPVNWEETWPVLLRAIEEVAPRWVLMLGLAGKRSVISVESRGCNNSGETTDNRGKLPQYSVITEGGEEYLYATLPVDEIVAAIEALGIPVEQSEDAGSYLCNHSLYRTLEWVAENVREGEIKAGFIHLPNMPEQADEIAGLPLEDMVAAIRAAIEAIVRPAAIKIEV